MKNTKLFAMAMLHASCDTRIYQHPMVEWDAWAKRVQVYHGDGKALRAAWCVFPGELGRFVAASTTILSCTKIILPKYRRYIDAFERKNFVIFVASHERKHCKLSN